MDFHFLSRLKKHPAIGDKINELNKYKKVIYRGDGIKRLTDNARKKLAPRQKKEIKPFAEISKTPIIELDNINRYYSWVNRGNIPREADLMVKSGRVEELYKSGNAILIKSRTKDESEPVISFVDKNCVFREKVLGIATETNSDDLKYFYGLFIANLSTYFQFLTSSSWGIFYPEIAQDEYLSLPYAKIQGRERFIGLVNRFIDHYRDYYSKSSTDAEKFELVGDEPPSPVSLEEFSEINKMINEAYEIDEIEKDLIDYALDVSRYLFQENKVYEKALRRVDEEEIKKYAGIFYKHFSNIYDAPGEYFRIEYFYLDYFIAMKFKIVKKKPAKGEEIVKSQEADYKRVFQALVQKTSLYKITNDLYINKIVKGFEEDFFYIIKPNELKSWHRAAAHMDLSEFIHAINKAELIRMRKEHNG
jgi:hypothetical protein